MAKRGGPCGPVRGPQVKNAGRDDLFNPLTRISPQPAQVSSGAGRGGLTRKPARKKYWHLVAAGQPKLGHAN